LHKSLKVSGIAIAVALLTALPAAAVSINLGGGSNSGATVDSNLLNDAGTDTSVRINLGNGGAGSDPTANVDLFGTGDQSTTANVTLGNGSDGTNSTVLVDLFGVGAGSGGTAARVAIGTGGIGGAGGNDAAIDLFGPGGAGGDGGNGNGGAGGNGGVGGNGGARTVGTVQIAAAGKVPATNCFAPNAEQQAKLVARHDYSQTTASWGEVGQLKVIDVGLCSAAGASIASQSNIGELQSYIGAHPEIRAGLDKLGRSPAEVIAGDKTDTTLTLYVM